MAEEGDGLRRSRRLQQKRDKPAPTMNDAPTPTTSARCKARGRRAGGATITTPRQAPAAGQRALRKRAAAAAGVAVAPPVKKARPEAMITGYWDLLPSELTETIINICTPRQMAMLQTSCRYFTTKLNLETTCERRLKEISRAKGLAPCKRAGERWCSLLHFINAQSAAAAQATALAFGGYHTSALLVPVDNSGYRDHPHSLYTWGRGFHGQLGHNTHDDLAMPESLCLGYAPCTELPNMEEEITAAVVACGTDHTATISRRGQLFTWGLGNSGELGHDDLTFLDTPFPLRAYLFQHEHIRIVSVACGGNHTLAIAENGTLWSCGRNKSGQLGHGTVLDSTGLMRVINLPRGARIVSAGAGALHSMALASDGSLFTWGDARYGQLGHMHLQSNLPNHNPFQRWPLKIACLSPASLMPYNRVTAISCGTWHGMAVTVGGGLLAFGRNHHGQLGTGHTRNMWRPTDISTAFQPGDGSMYYRAAQVACGAMHSLVLVAHRGRQAACSTGYNYFGQLGLGHTKEQHTLQAIPAVRDPVALVAGDHNSGAISGDGTVFVWGRNDWGQLGLDDTRGRWQPEALFGYKAVHPDRTLRKSKRSAPRMRAIAPAPSQQATPKCSEHGSCGNEAKEEAGVAQQQEQQQPQPAPQP